MGGTRECGGSWPWPFWGGAARTSGWRLAGPRCGVAVVEDPAHIGHCRWEPKGWRSPWATVGRGINEGHSGDGLVHVSKIQISSPQFQPPPSIHHPLGTSFPSIFWCVLVAPHKVNKKPSLSAKNALRTIQAQTQLGAPYVFYSRLDLGVGA